MILKETEQGGKGHIVSIVSNECHLQTDIQDIVQKEIGKDKTIMMHTRLTNDRTFDVFHPLKSISVQPEVIDANTLLKLVIPSTFHSLMGLITTRCISL